MENEEKEIIALADGTKIISGQIIEGTGVMSPAVAELEVKEVV